MKKDWFCINKECDYFAKPCPTDWDTDEGEIWCKACGEICDWGDEVDRLNVVLKEATKSIRNV